MPNSEMPSSVELTSAPLKAARRTAALLSAFLVVCALALAPGTALAAVGVANSEVTYFDEDTGAYEAVARDGGVPWSVSGSDFSPGGKPMVLDLKIRNETENPQEFRALMSANPNDLGATRGNPSDLLFRVFVDGKDQGEKRLGDVFAQDAAYEDDANVRQIGEGVSITGKPGDIHTVRVEVRLPQESGNESQGVRFGANGAVIPGALPATTPPIPSEPEPSDSSSASASVTPSEPAPGDSSSASASVTPSQPEPSDSSSASASTTPTPSDSTSASATPTDGPSATQTSGPDPTAPPTFTVPPTFPSTPKPSGSATTSTAAPAPSSSSPAPPPGHGEDPSDNGDDNGNGDGPRGPGSLPRTGAGVAGAMGLALVLIGAGTVTVLLGRRRS